MAVILTAEIIHAFVPVCLLLSLAFWSAVIPAAIFAMAFYYATTGAVLPDGPTRRDDNVPCVVIIPPPPVNKFSSS